ncbi:MAG: hypothetical protein R6V44_08545 [Paracoccaceae bacterium]
MDAIAQRVELGLTAEEAAALRRAAAREGVAPEALLRRTLREGLRLSERGPGGAPPDERVARLFE